MNNTDKDSKVPMQLVTVDITTSQTLTYEGEITLEIPASIDDDYDRLQACQELLDVLDDNNDKQLSLDDECEDSCFNWSGVETTSVLTVDIVEVTLLP